MQLQTSSDLLLGQMASGDACSNYLTL